LAAIGAIFEPGGDMATLRERLTESLGRFPHDVERIWSNETMMVAGCLNHTHGGEPGFAISADGKVAAILDGYLMNPDELVTDLEARGVVLDLPGDAQIALRAYEAWGEDCARRMLGEFALIIGDGRQGQLFLARDHIGFFPLYYRMEGKRLIVASDFATITALSQTPPRPDPMFLAQTITNRWYLREATPWRGVKRLVRAHVAHYAGRSLETQRYWTPPTEVSIRYRRDEDYAEHYRELLIECVKRCGRSDHRVAVALSGGLDSSAIFSIAHLLDQRDEWPAPGFAAYTLAAREGENAYELPYARAAAAFCGAPLAEVPLFDPDIDWYTKDARWHRDLPIPSNGAMMLDMERRMVADGCRVVLNGSGGDEWLQGPSHYLAEHLRAGEFDGFFRALSEDAGADGWPRSLRRAVHQSAAEYAPRWLRAPLRKALRARRRRRDAAMSWLRPEWREALGEAQETFEASLPDNPLAWSKVNLATTPFGDLAHQMMGRQRAKIGLHSRHPMLSRAFIEFSARTPAHIKRRGAMRKVVHRQAMAGLVAPEVLERETKANFTNTNIDTQFAAYVRKHAGEQLSLLCVEDKLSSILDVDFTSEDGDFWAWEIWGLYASAAFLYDCETATRT
jgi:asparagine synthase (glutamine-hydrolysing)